MTRREEIQALNWAVSWHLLISGTLKLDSVSSLFMKSKMKNFPKNSLVVVGWATHTIPTFTAKVGEAILPKVVLNWRTKTKPCLGGHGEQPLQEVLRSGVPLASHPTAGHPEQELTHVGRHLGRDPAPRVRIQHFSDKVADDLGNSICRERREILDTSAKEGHIFQNA